MISIKNQGSFRFGWVAVGPKGETSGHCDNPVDAVNASKGWHNALESGINEPNDDGEWLHYVFGHAFPTAYGVDTRHLSTINETITTLTSCEGCRGYGGSVYFLEQLPPGLWVKVEHD